MPQNVERRSRTVALAWAVVAEVSLGGVLFVWWISPTAARSAGYGPRLSTAMVIMSMVFTALGMVAVLAVTHLSKGVRLTVTLLIAITAGGIIPLTLSGLSTVGGGQDSIPLVLAVISMEVVAVYIPRGGR